MNIIQNTDKTFWDLNNSHNPTLASYIKNIIDTKLFEGTLIFTLFPGQAICLVYPENISKEEIQDLIKKIINDLGVLQKSYILHNFYQDPKFSEGQKVVLSQEIEDEYDVENPFKFITYGAETSNFNDLEKIADLAYRGVSGEALVFLSEGVLLRITEHSITFRAENENLRSKMKKNVIEGKYGKVNAINNSPQDFLLS